MIFDGDHPTLTIAGRKTRLTRPRAGDDEPEPYGTGRRYPVQHTRQPTSLDADIDRRRGYAIETDAQVIVSAVDRATLGELTDVDAKAEGFRSLHLFREWWRERYDSWSDDTSVWVVRFTLEHEARPRYLARTDAGHGDYTQDPHRAIDDAEAVDEFTVERFAKEAHGRGELLRGEQALRERARSLGRRVREETLRTGRAGVDVTPELDEIQRQLEAIERKRQAAA